MWWLLAQTSDGASEPYVPDDYYDYPAPSFGIGSLFDLIWGPLAWLYFPFVIWMAVYCSRNDTDSRNWMWIILVLHPFGSLAYFFIRWLPSTQFTLPRFLQRYTRGKDLRRLEVSAHQIGNSHQFVLWGDLLREVGQWDRAGEAYASALKKDAASLPALWGAACVDFRHQNFTAARDRAKTILDRDFTYKFGDVSLLYGRSLKELGERDAAKAHLQEHIRRWRHPEALFALASILADEGDNETARSHLVSMIQDIEASPRAISRKFFFWKGRAKRLLGKLG